MAKEFINKIGELPVKDTLDRWRHIVEMRKSSQRASRFSMFYVAGDDEDINTVTKTFAQAIGIEPDEIVEVKVNEWSTDLRTNLNELPDQMLQKEAIFISASGFEEVLKNADWVIKARRGHDWDQNVKESESLSEKLKNNSVVIITKIKKSTGHEVYEKAIRSALISQFKDGIIEVK